MNDAWNHELQKAYLDAQDQVLPGPNCPSPDLIWDVVTAGETTHQKLEILEHTATCPACAGVWRLATGMVEQVPEIQPEESSLRPKKRYRPVLWSAAVAAAMVLVFWVITPLTRQPPNYRIEAESLIQSTAPAILDRNHCLLQWTVDTKQEVVSFNLLISTADLEPLISVDGITETQVLISPSTLKNIPQGGQILWRVSAISTDGRRLLSETFINELN